MFLKIPGPDFKIRAQDLYKQWDKNTNMENKNISGKHRVSPIYIILAGFSFSFSFSLCFYLCFLLLFLGAFVWPLDSPRFAPLAEFFPCGPRAYLSLSLFLFVFVVFFVCFCMALGFAPPNRE